MLTNCHELDAEREERCNLQKDMLPWSIDLRKLRNRRWQANFPPARRDDLPIL